MKIVKEGKWHLPWSAEIACPTCEAILLVEEPDVKPVDYGTGYWCACMICGKKVPLDKKILPQRITEACDLKRKYSTGSAWD